MLSQIKSRTDWLQRYALQFSLAGALIAGPAFNGVAFANDANAVKNSPSVANDNEANKKNENKPETKTDAKTAAEMAKVVEALEERVRQLEEKLAKLNTGSTAAETTTASAADVAKPVTMDEVAKSAAITEIKNEITAVQEEAKKNEGILKFFRDVEVSGIVDGYYSYNNNQIDMFTQGRAFDVRHNALSLQLAKLTLNKANSKDSPLGFRIDLGLGDTVDRIISVSDSSRNDATKHILQAYASYVAPIGSGLTIDFGKFYTPVGAEVIETKDNFNYSRGWLFAFGPYYHTGLRAKYSFNDKVALTGFLLNGWDNLFENNVNKNAGKTVGFQIGLTPSKKFALTQTYLAGPENPLANVPDVALQDNWRHIADTVASIYVTDKFTLLGNFVYGSDGDAVGNRGSWTGFAGYFKYAFNDRFAFSPRFEVFNDKDGLRTGVAQTVKDITLTQEVKLMNNFLTRFEFRRDFSNQKFFTNYDGVSKGNQNTFIIGLSYFFTNREP